MFFFGSVLFKDVSLKVVLVTSLAIRVLKLETGESIFSHDFANAISSIRQISWQVSEVALIADDKSLFVLRLSPINGCEKLQIFRNAICCAAISDLCDWGFVQENNVLTIMKEGVQLAVNSIGVKQIAFQECRVFVQDGEKILSWKWQ